MLLETVELSYEKCETSTRAVRQSDEPHHCLLVSTNHAATMSAS